MVAHRRTNPQNQQKNYRVYDASYDDDDGGYDISDIWSNVPVVTTVSPVPTSLATIVTVIIDSRLHRCWPKRADTQAKAAMNRVATKIRLFMLAGGLEQAEAETTNATNYSLATQDARVQKLKTLTTNIHICTLSHII